MRVCAFIVAAGVLAHAPARADEYVVSQIAWAGGLKLASLQPAPAPVSAAAPAKEIRATSGWASYYRDGRLTASGERFAPLGFTAAHRTLPFGTKVRVTNQKTGLSVVVRVNDRGPFVAGRSLDLSLGAARAIGLDHQGVAQVTMQVQ